MSQPTAVYSTRTDLRVLASLVHYWNSKGLTPHSASEVHRMSIELFVEILQERGLTRRYSSTMEARNFLERLGILKSLSPRNQSTLIKQLQKEELISQGIDPSYARKKGVSNIAPDQLERAKEILQQKIDEEDSEGVVGAVFGKREREE